MSYDEAKATHQMFNIRPEGPIEREIPVELFASCNVPVRYHGLTLDSWIAEGGDGQVAAYMRDYLGNMRKVIQSGLNLMLIGPNGSGKTGLAALVVTAWLKASLNHYGYHDCGMPSDKGAWFMRMSDVLDFFMSARQYNRSDYNERRRMIYGADLLVIDDLNEMFSAYDNLDKHRLVDVIKQRAAHKKLTVITTNLRATPRKDEEQSQLDLVLGDTGTDVVAETYRTMIVLGRIRKGPTDPWL